MACTPVVCADNICFSGIALASALSVAVLRSPKTGPKCRRFERPLKTNISAHTPWQIVNPGVICVYDISELSAGGS